MNPHEILNELDRLGITLWWQQLSADQDPGTRLRTNQPQRVSPELRAAIDAHTDTLLKLVRWEPSKQAAGIRIRKPNQREGKT